MDEPKYFSTIENDNEGINLPRSETKSYLHLSAAKQNGKFEHESNMGSGKFELVRQNNHGKFEIHTSNRKSVYVLNLDRDITGDFVDPLKIDLLILDKNTCGIVAECEFQEETWVNLRPVLEKRREKKICYVFDLDRDESLGGRVSRDTDEVIITKEKLRKYNFHLPRFAGEYDRSYQQRVNSIPNFEKILSDLSIFFSETSIDPLLLSWKDKNYLVILIAHVGIQEVVSFSRFFGINGVKAILSRDISDEWESKLLSLDKSSRSKDIIDKFSPLFLCYEDMEEELKKLSEREDIMVYVADTRHLLHEDIVMAMNRLFADEKGDMEEIYDQLKIKNLKYAVISKLLNRKFDQYNNNFSLNDIKSSDLEVVGGGSLSVEDISTMRSIYSHNQRESAVHDELLKGFDTRVKDPKAKFYIFKWQGKIQSFMALSDDGKDNSLYMSSVNVEPSARGYKIGEAMLDQVVEQAAKEHVITADCDSKLPISSKYIESGFVGTFYWEDKNKETGQSDWILDITRNDRMNHSYWGKQQTNTEAIVNSRGKHPDTVTIEVANTQAELPFHLLQEGHVLTRMFKDGSGLWYGVFEEARAREETTRE